MKKESKKKRELPESGLWQLPFLIDVRKSDQCAHRFSGNANGRNSGPVSHLSGSGEPIDRILVTFTDHVLVGIVKDDLDGILTVTAADPGVSIFLADHHGDAVEFTHVVMKRTQGSVGLAGAVLFVRLDQIESNALRVTAFNHVAWQEPDQLRALEEGHRWAAGGDL